MDAPMLDGRPADPARLRTASLQTAALLAERLDAAAAAVLRDDFGHVDTAADEPLALA